MIRENMPKKVYKSIEKVVRIFFARSLDHLWINHRVVIRLDKCLRLIVTGPRVPDARIISTIYDKVSTFTGGWSS